MSKKTLYYISSLYVGLPSLLFLIFWLKPVLAITFSFLFLTSFILLCKQIFDEKSTAANLRKNDLLLLLCFAIFLTFFSGIAGFTNLNFDSKFHFSKFYDLFAYDLPSYYPQVSSYPCYYFGYYILPSLLAKLLGENSLIALSFLWTLAGFYLGLIWFFDLAKRQFRTVILAFLCGGILGNFYTLYLHYQSFLSIGNEPFSSAFLTYLPLLPQVNWVPNQLIVTMICTCIIIDDIFYKKLLYRPYFVALSMLFWAPFPAVSLCLLFAFLVIRHWFLVKNSFITIVKSFLYLSISTIVFLPIMIYLSGSNSGIISGFIWKFDSNWLAIWLIFVFFEVWILFFYIPKKENSLRPILIFSVVALSLFPIYRIGMSNDFVARISMPLLLVLYLCFAENLKLKNKMQMLVFLLGLIIPLKYIAKSLVKFGEDKPTSYHFFTNTYAGLKTGYGQTGADEYLLKNDSFFNKYMLKKP